MRCHLTKTTYSLHAPHRVAFPAKHPVRMEEGAFDIFDIIAGDYEFFSSQTLLVFLFKYKSCDLD